MRLRNKIMIITMLAMLAFIGLGFASWTFKNSVETSNVTFEDKVAVAVEMDRTFQLKAYADSSHTIEVSQIYLICDAPTVATSDYLAGAGVYWAYDAAGEHAITNLYIRGQLEYNAEDSVLPVSTVDVTFTVNNTLVNNTYVEFDSTATVGGTVQNIAVSDGANVDYTLVLPTPSYTAAVLAYNSVAQVTAMNTALASAFTSQGIQVSASISAKLPVA